MADAGTDRAGWRRRVAGVVYWSGVSVLGLYLLALLTVCVLWAIWGPSMGVFEFPKEKTRYLGSWRGAFPRISLLTLGVAMLVLGVVAGALRRLGLYLTTLSMLPMFGSIVLLVRSYGGWEFVVWRDYSHTPEYCLTRTRSVGISSGLMFLSVSQGVIPPAPDEYQQRRDREAEPPLRWHRSLPIEDPTRLESSQFPGFLTRRGIYWRSGSSRSWLGREEPRVGGFKLRLPLPALVLVFSVPVFWKGARLLRKARRKTLGLCVICGYDLRASPDQCPECGHPAEARGSIKKDAIQTAPGPR